MEKEERKRKRAKKKPPKKSLPGRERPTSDCPEIYFL
jgi:hypothetical protein